MNKPTTYHLEIEDKELWKWFRAYCIQQGLTVDQQILELIQDLRIDVLEGSPVWRTEV